MKFSTYFLSLFLLQSLMAGAQTPKPALLVLNKSANELAIVDPKAMKVVGRVPVGDGPHEVASDGKLAFVTNYGSRMPGTTISIVDLANQKEIRRFELPMMQRPHGIAVSDGKACFTADDLSAGASSPLGIVSCYDPAGGKSAWNWKTGQQGTHMVVFSKDGKKVFTTNIQGNSVSIFDHAAPAASQSTVVNVGMAPEAIDLSPDGKELWVGHSRDGGVSVISADSKKVIRTLPISTKRSNRLKFTPDGSKVLVSDMEGNEIVVLDAKTKQQLKRIKTGDHPEGIQMDPTGAKAFVALAGEDTVITVDLKTLEISGKLQTGKGPDGLAWIN